MCDDCGMKLLVERDAVRRYVLGGVPHIELHGVEVTRCPACGVESVGIPRIAQLHTVIAHGFVTQPRMLAPTEIQFLRKHVGLSGADLAQRMGVSRETVSRWESGAQPMGPVADRLLRLLVVTHAPSESYAADDLLKSLSNQAAPKRLPRTALANTRARGWLAS